MSTDIEWTDETWNPVVGCTPVSPGCLNCYAATMARRLEAMGKRGYEPRRVDVEGRDVTNLPGLQDGSDKTVRIAEVKAGRAVFTGDVRTLPDRLQDPLHWREPRRVFVNSMSDLFHESVPFEFIDRVFAVMALTPRHTFQILTKRPERMAEYLNGQVGTVKGNGRRERVLGLAWSLLGDVNFMGYKKGSSGKGRKYEAKWPLLNVWLGTSVEDQKQADKRIPHLLKCPAAIRFLSCEPLLGPIDFKRRCPDGCDGECGHPSPYMLLQSATCIDSHIDWVIVGGESGHISKVRSTDIEDIRGIVKQCQAADVAVFVKQLGSKVFSTHDEEEARCAHCGTSGPSDIFDVLGADPDMLFCNKCNVQIRFRWNLKAKKGGDMAEWPEDLRVREMPRPTPF